MTTDTSTRDLFERAKTKVLLAVEKAFEACDGLAHTAFDGVDDAPEAFLMFAFVYSDDTMTLAAVPEGLPYDPYQKAAALSTIGESAANHSSTLVAVGCAMAAWISVQKPDGQRIQPSQDPDRGEVIVVAAMGVTKMNKGIVYDIRKTPSGKTVMSRRDTEGEKHNYFILEEIFKAYARKTVPKQPREGGYDQ